MNITKYHISTFTANLYAIIISIFFIESYSLNNKSIFPVFFIFSIGILIFLTSVYYIIKPSNGVKIFIPQKSYLLLNLSISLLFSLFFIRGIGVSGIFYVISFSLLIFIAEHVIFDGVKKWHL